MSKLKVNDLSIEIDHNTSILEALRKNNVYIKSSCGGHGNCSDCIIKILEGKENLNSPTFEESNLLGNVFHITKERLACQSLMEGDVTIDISNHSKHFDDEKRKLRGPVKKRSKAEYDKIIEDRKEKSKSRRDDETWFKHWEKSDDAASKRKGGGKRPRGFKDLSVDYSDLSENQEEKKNYKKENKE